ncbi:MAG: hypothetical protein ACRDN0_07820 [Trebonia sp.]
MTTARNGEPHRTNRDLLSTGTPGAVPVDNGDLAQGWIPGVGDLGNPVRRMG